MKTKEEILKQHSKGKVNPEDTFYPQKSALSAMDEYAAGIAQEFAEWTGACNVKALFLRFMQERAAK